MLVGADFLGAVFSRGRLHLIPAEHYDLDFESQGHIPRLIMLVCTTKGNILFSMVDYVGAQSYTLNVPVEFHLPMKCQP